MKNNTWNVGAKRFSISSFQSYNLFTVDHHQSDNSYTHGQYICPNGAFYTRYYLDSNRGLPSYQTTLTTSTFDFSDGTTYSYKQFTVKLIAFPVQLKVEIPISSGTELIHDMPNMKRGEGFWLKMQCTTNAMEFYIDEELVFSTGLVHSDSSITTNLPLITRHSLSDSSYYVVRDTHYTFCKCIN